MNRLQRIKRLDAVEQQLVHLPLPQVTVDRAFEVFRETGVLPEDARVASRVIELALQFQRGGTDLLMGIRHLKALADALERGGPLPPSPDECRRQLYHEAVYLSDDRRAAAREALVQQASQGVDVTSGDFLRGEPLPTFGTVGLHMTGYYERLAQGPDGARVRELYAEVEEMTAKHSDTPSWWDAALAALRMFGHHGELPVDRELRAAVGVLVELCEAADAEQPLG